MISPPLFLEIFDGSHSISNRSEALYAGLKLSNKGGAIQAATKALGASGTKL
jgi:hypothetical protein